MDCRALKKLSIIVPIYNSEKYLEQCLNTILMQTYKDFELILVDDASTDDSGKICERYAANDARIKVIHHDKNKGLSISREDGYYFTDSEWVSFVDNDDAISPNMYERLMENTIDENVDLVCIRGEDCPSGNMKNPVWEKKEDNIFSLTGYEACSEIYSGKLKFGFVQPVWGKAIKRSLIEKARIEILPYREKLYWVFFEDVLFMPMVFYYAGKVVFDDQLMYMHRRFLTNLSSTLQPKEFHYEAVEAGIIVLRFLERHHLMDAFEKHMVGCFLNMQSTWYKVWKNETNKRKKIQFDKLIDAFYDEYGQKLRNMQIKSLSDRIVRLTIVFFEKHKVFWGITIGNIYFKLLRRKTYK